MPCNCAQSPGNCESREGKANGPLQEGNQGEIPAGSDLCIVPQKTNATGQGKGAGVPGRGTGLGDSMEVGGEVSQGRWGRGAGAELGSLLPAWPPKGAEERLLNEKREMSE